MKKLLLGAMALMAFSIAIIATQISCNKDATAQAIPNYQPSNLIVFTKLQNSTDPNFTSNEINISNLDGTAQRYVPVQLPAHVIVKEVKLTPNGDKLIFTTRNILIDNNKGSLYSCNLDGSGLTKLVDGDNSDFTLSLQDIK